jgi:S-DNA-T family DNA segregation ATPase FtsK/SpoIIIE
VAVVTLAVASGLTLRDMGAGLRRLAVDTAAGARDLAGAIEDLGDPDADDLDGYVPQSAVAEAVPIPEPPAAQPTPTVASDDDADEHGASGDAEEQPLGKRRWTLPALDQVLDPAPEIIAGPDDAEAKARLIEDTYAEFGVPVTVVEINRGPTITQFGLEPGYVTRAGRRSRVKVSKIVSLQNDLALALAASPLRMQAPVPGRPFVGVEVPNADAAVVTLRGVIESDGFAKLAGRGGLPVALGRDTSGHSVAADLAAMPHLLIAGATGAGKSVALNGIVCTMLVTHTPDSLRLLLVDPKRVEMAPFRGLPHLASPVVVDVERVVGVLQWAVREMDRRYRLFAEHGARNIQAFNAKAARIDQDPLPYLVLVVDELADLMMMAPEEVERLITRLAQLARATGIHLIIATQRPSVDVVTGLIKANFPSRIAFAVASSTDSRVILDANGAEKLLGRGDMLYVSSDSSKLRRLQGCYVSESEIERITNYWRRAVPADVQASEEAQRLGVPDSLIAADQWDEMMREDDGDARDPLWNDVVSLLREHQSVSTSFLQRKLRIGYSRAARIVDLLEEEGLVGPSQGSQPRDVLVDFDAEGHVLESEEDPEPAPVAPAAGADADG